MTQLTRDGIRDAVDEIEVVDRLTFTAGRRTIGPDEEYTIRTILTEKYEYVDNEVFKLRPKQAEKQLFDNAPSIEMPDTSWYHPVMEDRKSVV